MEQTLTAKTLLIAAALVQYSFMQETDWPASQRDAGQITDDML